MGTIFIKALVSDILLIQDNVLSNAGAWLSNNTLRFSSSAEQCHTQKFYLRCFNLDFDAVKSKFGLLIEQIKKTTSKRTSKMMMTSKMKRTSKMKTTSKM